MVPVPAIEKARLAELHSLNVTPDELIAELQALCEVAAKLAGTPVALVSLVDAHEQRFAANVGLPGMSGTPRDIALCAHTITCDAPFIVPDTKQDQRFESNPLVVDAPGIRSYAGIPLATSHKMNVGTLCVIDFEPRDFSHEVIRDLSRLGAAAAALLMAHRDRSALELELQNSHKREVSLYKAASHDALTGLLNAGRFKTTVSDWFKAYAGTHKAALCLVDVDNFKSINDRYGHSFGDEYLAQVAGAMSTICRSNDVVGRLGGDEFGLFVFDLNDPLVEVSAILQRLRDEFGRIPGQFDKPELGRASIGVAFTPEHAQNFEDLYQRADAALYASKEAGRNRSTVYDPGLGSTHNIRVLRTRITAALERGDIRSYYQPKVEIATGRTVGFEVLARWLDERRGQLAAGEFASAFQDRYLSPMLTRAMFERAAEDYAGWRDAGLPVKRLSVNTTLYDLSDNKFIPDINAIIQNAGLSWDGITIEVTEAVVLGEENDTVFRTLQEMRALGAMIALDDFGTGYGGLQHLRSWPVDVVKIDRSFIKGLPESKDDERIVRAITDLAHDFNMLICVEGIETEGQLEVIRRLKCDKGQGYLFSPALSAEDAQDYLARETGNPEAASSASVEDGDGPLDLAVGT